MEVNEKLRNLQLVELELFKKFLKVAERLDIEYFALGGTLLGAVRHKGFIPWDDDMDIGIPREDYEKFIAYCRKHKVPFEMHSFKNDKNYHRLFAHIEDPSVKIKRCDKSVEEICNAWIDIFPLDGMPDNKILRNIHKYHILYRRAMYRLSNFSNAVDINKKNRPLHEKIIIQIGKIFPMEKILDVRKEVVKLDRVLKKYPYKKCSYLVNAMGAYKFDEMFHKKYYGKGKLYKFEDIYINGPVDYDTVCRQLYGDYMKPPSEDVKNHHASEIIS